MYYHSIMLLCLPRDRRIGEDGAMSTVYTLFDTKFRNNKPYSVVPLLILRTPESKDLCTIKFQISMIGPYEKRLNCNVTTR
jgi:hypothetical protein